MTIRGGQLRSGALPRELKQVETAAEVGRVGQGEELAERGGIRISFEIEQPFATDLGEPSPLATEEPGLATESKCGLSDGGEIHMRGDVDFPWSGERIFCGTVLGKRPEGAGGASGEVVVRPGKAVVCPEQQAGAEAAGERGEEFLVVRADFRAVVFREIGPQWVERGEKLGIGDLTGRFPDALAAGRNPDATLAPTAGFPLDEVKGQGVQQLVAEGDSRQRIGSKRGGVRGEAHFLVKLGKSLTLCSLEAEQRLRDGVFTSGEGLRVEPGKGG